MFLRPRPSSVAAPGDLRPGDEAPRTPGARYIRRVRGRPLRRWLALSFRPQSDRRTIPMPAGQSPPLHTGRALDPALGRKPLPMLVDGSPCRACGLPRDLGQRPRDASPADVCADNLERGHLLRARLSLAPRPLCPPLGRGSGGVASLEQPPRRRATRRLGQPGGQGLPDTFARSVVLARTQSTPWRRSRGTEADSNARRERLHIVKGREAASTRASTGVAAGDVPARRCHHRAPTASWREVARAVPLRGVGALVAAAAVAGGAARGGAGGAVARRIQHGPDLARHVDEARSRPRAPAVGVAPGDESVVTGAATLDARARIASSPAVGLALCAPACLPTSPSRRPFPEAGPCRRGATTTRRWSRGAAEGAPIDRRTLSTVRTGSIP